MPTVNVLRDELFAALGRTYTDEEFDQLCFEFGIELDEVTSEKEMVQRERGAGATAGENLKEEVVYKIDVPANRYDILCLEGLARALRVFLELEQPPVYRVVNQPQLIQMTVKAETFPLRPFAVCAVLRDVTFTQQSYNSFIDLQDKLHHNICRKRTLVAIGTHDLDTLQGPFTYEALPPQQINFVPLNKEQSVDGEQLMKLYETDNKLKHFLPIIRDSPVYPVIYDANRTVLSLPPIINSNHSKITLNTRNVFIECTATDLTKANVVLNTMVAMFAQYCAQPFTVEQVEVTYERTGQKHTTPDVASRTLDADVNYINKLIGINLPGEEMARVVRKMCLGATLDKEANKITVEVPITRSDILHACDVAEDVAIAYGFNKLTRQVPPTQTVGRQQPLNKLTDLLRQELAQAGYSEVLTFALCSRDENFAFLRQADPASEGYKGPKSLSAAAGFELAAPCVTIANPKTFEFQIARSSMLPGMLKTLQSNKQYPVPLDLFEVSDVVVRDEASDVGARNERRLIACHVDVTSAFQVVHGLLDLLMVKLGVKRVAEGEDNGFYIRPTDNNTFFPGRSADIYYKNKKVGIYGVIHPEVMGRFDLVYPISVIEMQVEPFL